MPVISSLGLSAFSESKKDAIKSEVSDSWFKMCGPVQFADDAAIGVALQFPYYNSSANSNVDGEYTYRGMLVSTTSEGDIRYVRKPLSSSSGVSSYTSSVSTSARRIAVGTESQSGGITYARLDMFDTSGNVLSSTRFYSSNTTSNPLTFLSGIAIPERNGTWNTTTSQNTYENVTDTVGVFGKVNNTPIFFDFFPDSSRKYVGNTTFTFSTLSEITCACEVIESGNKYYYIAGRDSNTTKDLVVYKIGPSTAPTVVWQKKYAPFSAETGGTGNRFTYAPVAIRYDKHIGKILVLANYVDTSATFFGDATIPSGNNTGLNSGAVLLSIDPSNGNTTNNYISLFKPYQKPAWATGISIGDPHPNATTSTDLLYNTAYFISMTSSTSETFQSQYPDPFTPSYICSYSKGSLIDNSSPSDMVAGIRITSSVAPQGTPVYRGVFAKVGGYSSASLVYVQEPNVSASYVVYNVKGQAVIHSDSNIITPSYFSLQLEPGSPFNNTKYTSNSSFAYVSKNDKSSQLTLYTYSLSAVVYDPIHQYCQTITYPTAPSNTISGWVTGTGSYTADPNISNYIGAFTARTFDLGPASYNPPLKALPNYLERLIYSVWNPTSNEINYVITDPLTGKTQTIPNVALITFSDSQGRTLRLRPIGQGAGFVDIENAFYSNREGVGQYNGNLTWSSTGGLVTVSTFPTYAETDVIFVTKYYQAAASAFFEYSTSDTVAPFAPPSSFSWNLYIEKDLSPSSLVDVYGGRTHTNYINGDPGFGASELIPQIATMYGNNLINIITGDTNDTIIISRDNSTYPVGGTGGPQTEINSGKAYPGLGADTVIIIGRNEGSASNVLFSTSTGDDKLINASIGMGRVVMTPSGGADRMVIAGAIGYSAGYQYTVVTGLLSTSGDRVDLSLLFKSNGARVASTADLSVTYSGGNYTINLAGYYLSRNGTFADSTRIIGGSIILNSVTTTNATNSLLFNQGTTLSSLLGSTLYNRLVSESA